jgi:putative ABC transport system ATP-binding protein
VLRLEHVSKVYRTTEVETVALDDLSLDVGAGEFLAVMGPSGCGKSTLLNVMGLIDSPTSGSYWFRGENLAQCSEEELTLRRRGEVGFVFQNFNLIENLNVSENVEVALLYLGVPRAERRARVGAALERVDLAHRAHHMPKQLSGGQQQRVAVARALVARPELILADEPTGNLDTANGEALMDLLLALVSGGTTVLMATHSEAHASRAHRVVQMLDGRIVDTAED